MFRAQGRPAARSCQSTTCRKGLSEGWTNGLAEGEAQAIIKHIKNRRIRRIPDSLILKDLLSVFELDKTQANQYMERK
jgi:hypothetical protein